uniref:Uncharacterized protein n=1 Tax=Oryza glumipatula TaxID=40148 RepID=A0A0D9ZB99_9ORYZ
MSAALRAGRKEYWQKEGRTIAKGHLHDQLEKSAKAQGEAEEAVREEPEAGDGEADADGQDHPRFVRPPFWDWRSTDEKFVAYKGLPKIRYSCQPIYREMVINGNSYMVLKVAGWMRKHPGRTLQDYD